MPRLSHLATTVAGSTLLLLTGLPPGASHAFAQQQCAAAEDPAPIADGALAQAIRKQLGLTAVDVTCGEMLKLRELSARDAGIESLDGLEHATSLQRLDASRNSITDLAPLLALRQLTELRLERNRIADLAPLVKNTRIGAGVRLNVTLNCLDVSTGTDDRQAVDTLVKRGANVDFRQQKEAADCATNP